MLRREEHEAESAGHEPNASAGGAGAPPDPTGPNRAPDLTREYATADVTVQWYAGRCIHSGNCVRALQAVFDPRRRPWVDPTAASADAIVAAVVRCPSGALHYTRHDGGGIERPDVPATITPMPDGPLYLRGDLEARMPDGTPVRRDVRAALCRCGRGQAMPFCDNTCRTTGWRENDIYGSL
jgi:uncharacterized Fe-S cluster protein YjdI/CDGSH-type Zn-finger protein